MTSEIDFDKDPNRQYVEAHKVELLEKYRGQYVAIFEGKLVDSDTSDENLVLRTSKDHHGSIMIHPVTDKPQRRLRLPVLFGGSK